MGKSFSSRRHAGAETQKPGGGGGGASDGFEREQWGQTGNSHRAAGSHGALGPPSGLGSWLGVR